jgi:hypothetical protein
MRVILQPCAGHEARRHFENTIKQPVPIDVILRDVPRHIANHLQGVFEGRKEVPTWGVTAGGREVNVKRWERIEPGDLVLFSQGNRVFLSATIAAKAHAPGLARTLWGTDTRGNTWEYVYFLDELKGVDIPVGEVNRTLGYQANNRIQGFRILKEGPSERLALALELESHKHGPSLTPHEYIDLITDKLNDLGDLDTERVAKARKEQGFLRHYLFGDRQLAECCLCGKKYSVDFLVAAHVKPRALCSPEERRDYQNIVAPMCKNGCDALYELGYVVIDDSGKVVRGRTETESAGVSEAVEKLLGRPCKAWNEGTRRYFAWHRKSHLVEVSNQKSAL